nr:Twin-arginine translocation pathway signal sequence domain-containing protein [Planctomycetota bacterium]
MSSIPLTRRDLLRVACATGVGMLVPSLAQASGALTAPDWTRALVLIEFDGGNDGLNTFVPWQDATYYSRRGALAVQPTDTWDLDGGPLRINKALGYDWMRALWSRGELAVVRGVGMANPNRSHFRGIEIWNTGADSTAVLGDGWLRRAYAACAVDQSALTAH